MYFRKESRFLLYVYPEILAPLQNEPSALWGKMRAGQMLEHLELSFRIAMGKLQLPSPYTEEQQQRAYHLIFEQGQVLQRNIALSYPAYMSDSKAKYMLGALKKKLFVAVAAFVEYWQNYGESKIEHPSFGFLGREDWFYFQSLHCRHHACQFALLGEECLLP